jgi:predicted nucleic acid-binding Zn ribbon protein
MKDKPLKKCPECGKAALERLIGIGAAVLFKGSGFYQTDYRTESYKSGQKAETPAAPASESKGGDAKPAETKSESKPAAKEPAAAPASTKNAKPGKKD